MSGARTSSTGAPPAQWVTPSLGVCILVGLAALVYGFLGGQPLLGWQSLHIAFIYILGPTFAGVLISVIYELTDSRWGQNVKRMTESTVALVPVALLAFVGAALGHHHVMEAGHQGHTLAGGKVVWLDPTFLMLRDAGIIITLSLVSAFFIKNALRPALGAAIQQGAPIKSNPLAAWITSGYQGYEKELARCKRTRQVLAPIMVILYALGMTVFAFDYIMSLDPIWISTLFGAYFFITSLFMAWAMLSVAAALTRQVVGRGPFADYGRRIEDDDLHSLGKLLFAFCMLSMDFFWSQFVVIWYANIPEETTFLIRRVRLEPWNDVAWAVVIIGYALPFALLLFKKIKRTEGTLMGVSLLILFMMLIERTLLIAPSLFHLPSVDGGHGGEHVAEQAFHNIPMAASVLTALGVALGLVGLAGFSYRYVVKVFIHALPEKDLDDKGRPIEPDDDHHRGEPEAASGEAPDEASPEDEPAQEAEETSAEAEESEEAPPEDAEESEEAPPEDAEEREEAPPEDAEESDDDAEGSDDDDDERRKAREEADDE